MFKKYVGSKQFYKSLLLLTIPIMIQNGITNFVNMLDNVMVGSVGAAEMTGVAVCNQLFFVFNLCIFGAVSGAGIFGAQFFGKKDINGLRNTFRFKLLFCLFLAIACILLFVFKGQDLVMLYLHGKGEPDEIQATLNFAKSYMNIMLIGLIPASIVQTYSSTLRETGKSTLPMFAGCFAVIVNLFFNYLLIFGSWGFPRLGVVGAAIATVLSRFVEMFLIVFWTGKHRYENEFIIGAFSTLKVPKSLAINIAKKGFPLMLNETAWAAGIAMLNQCYSQCGYEVVSATNIASTFFDVFAVAFIAIGNAIGIIIGQLLGAGKSEQARDDCRRLIAFSVTVTTLISAVFFVLSPYIPLLYNVSDEIRATATGLLMVCACEMPVDSFVHAAYFTIRAGGKAFLTFLFDSCFVWLLMVPIAFILVKFTHLSIIPIYAITQSLIVIKCVIGAVLIKKGIWIKNIVDNK